MFCIPCPLISARNTKILTYFLAHLCVWEKYQCLICNLNLSMIFLNESVESVNILQLVRVIWSNTLMEISVNLFYISKISFQIYMEMFTKILLEKYDWSGMAATLKYDFPTEAMYIGYLYKYTLNIPSIQGTVQSTKMGISITLFYISKISFQIYGKIHWNSYYMNKCD